MSRRGLSLVEVLITSVVLATVGVAIYQVLSQTTRGVTTDRLTEAKRHLVLDLLERFSQPYTDLPALFAGQKSPSRLLTLDETFQVLSIPPTEIPALKAILETGKVHGFTLTWTPRQKSGRGNADLALRLDALWCAPVVSGDSPGPRTESFRLSFGRGKVDL
jgi:prepilin-type N-terminal cleavage/methylation domain-containing protein